MILLMPLTLPIYADRTTLYSQCEEASDLWRQLKMTAKFESDLVDTESGVGSGLLISMLKKLNLFRLTGLITLVLLL